MAVHRLNLLPPLREVPQMVARVSQSGPAQLPLGSLVGVAHRGAAGCTPWPGAALPQPSDEISLFPVMRTLPGLLMMCIPYLLWGQQREREDRNFLTLFCLPQLGVGLLTSDVNLVQFQVTALQHAGVHVLMRGGAKQVGMSSQ